MKPYCGNTLKKSLDYLLDIASVTGQKVDQNSDLETFCNLDFKDKNLDDNYTRGQWMCAYLQKIESLRTRRLLLFGSFVMILLVFIVFIFIFGVIVINRTSIIICLIFFIILCFLYYAANVARFQRDKVDLFELYNRSQVGLTPKQTIQMLTLLPEEYNNGYSSIYDTPNWSFPLDHQIDHYGYPLEWYWYVGTVNDKSNNLYSVQLLFLRQSIVSPDVAYNLGISLEQNQIFTSYIKIGSQKDKKLYQGRGCAIPSVSELVSLSSFPFSISIGNNILFSKNRNTANIYNKDNIFPLQWNIEEPIENISAALNLTDPKKIILRGDNGFDPPNMKGLGIGTLYYSWPRIKTNGVLKFENREIEVSGVGWIDHQIFAGTSPLGRFRSTIPRFIGNLSQMFRPTKINTGWNFIIIQLDDNSTYYFTSGLNDTDLDNDSNIEMVGKYSSPNNTMENIFGLGQIIRRIKGKSGNTYPCEWIIQSGSLKFIVECIIDEILVNLIRGDVVEVGATIYESTTKRNGRGWIENAGYTPNFDTIFMDYLNL